MKDPIWVVAMHELGSHAVFECLTHNGKEVSSNDRGVTVDYENVVRKLKGLNERAYELYYPEPN